MFEGGSAYMVGKMNGDHWYLYITSPTAPLTPPRTPVSEKNSNLSPTRMSSTSKIPTGIVAVNGDAIEDEHDETLEILMTDLDQENAKQFYLSHAAALANETTPAKANEARRDAHESLDIVKDSNADATFDVFGNGEDAERVLAESLTTEGHALGTVISDTCGLSGVYPPSIYPDAKIDAYLFTPCGLSANGVIPAPVAPSAADVPSKPASKAAHYFTVHVTPEPDCSFASFETNVPGGQHQARQTADVIEHVVGIFRPGRFSVTLFEAKGRLQGAAYDKRDDARRAWGEAAKQRMERIKGYRRIDRIVHDFEDYDLVFRYYEREDWVGYAGARVGEEL